LDFQVTGLFHQQWKSLRVHASPGRSMSQWTLASQKRLSGGLMPELRSASVVHHVALKPAYHSPDSVSSVLMMGNAAQPITFSGYDQCCGWRASSGLVSRKAFRSLGYEALARLLV
jgi:hypothetical protein